MKYNCIPFTYHSFILKNVSLKSREIFFSKFYLPCSSSFCSSSDGSSLFRLSRALILSSIALMSNTFGRFAPSLRSTSPALPFYNLMSRSSAMLRRTAEVSRAPRNPRLPPAKFLDYIRLFPFSSTVLKLKLVWSMN